MIMDHLGLLLIISVTVNCCLAVLLACCVQQEEDGLRWDKQQAEENRLLKIEKDVKLIKNRMKKKNKLPMGLNKSEDT